MASAFFTSPLSSAHNDIHRNLELRYKEFTTKLLRNRSVSRNSAALFVPEIRTGRTGGDPQASSRHSDHDARIAVF